MKTQLLNGTYTTNKDTGIVTVSSLGISNVNNMFESASIAIQWTAADHTDGTIAIYGSIDGMINLLDTVTISSASNAANCYILAITPMFEGFQLIYTKNSNTTITLLATLVSK